MRKFIAFLLALVLTAWSASGAFAVVYGETGYELEGYNEASAWEIDSVETLIKIRDDINSGKIDSSGKYYRLTADLDLTDYADWEAIGNPSKPFVGNFDGAGHTVKIAIDCTYSGSREYYTGLFGYLTAGGTVKNLSVAGSINSVVSNDAGIRVGGIAGYVGDSSNTTVENCDFDGTMTITGVSSRYSAFAGGIVGYMWGGTIKDCKFDGMMTITGASATSSYYAGGIVGYVRQYEKSQRLLDVLCNIYNCSVGSKNASTSIKSLYVYVTNNWTSAGGIAGYIYDARTKEVYNRLCVRIYDNYSRLKTAASMTKCLTYGGISSNELPYTCVNVYNNVEINPDDVPTPSIAAPVITTESLPSAVTGKAYSAAITATGDDITWTVGGLPGGLTFDSGTISGTPTVSGVFTITATAGNSAGADNKTFTLTVFDVSTPAGLDTSIKITTDALPSGKLGEEYNAEIETSGAMSGSVPTWIITGLPNGMNTSNDGSKAKISGTPTQAGTFTVKVAVSDTKTEASKNFTLKIAGGSSQSNKQEFTWNGHTYRVYTDKKKPEEARAFCEAQGGYLCTITSQEEQNAVYNFLKSNGYGEAYWLGGTDRGHEGTWVWLNGEAWSYSNWRTSSSEPNNGLGRGQDYMTIGMSSDWDGKWDDAFGGYDGYTDTLGFICEWGGDNLGEDTEILNGHRYRRFPDGMTWSQAKAYCETLGGHLVTITSQEEENVVEKLVLAGNKNSYWLGGQKNDNGEWSWIDDSAWSYTHWAAGQPDFDYEDKLMMYRLSNPAKPSVPGTWNNLIDAGTFEDETFFGTANFGFICEWDSTVGLLVITTDSLPNAKVGVSYDFTLTTNFGPAIWTLVSEDGELPDGITLDSSTGKLSGIPTKAGSFDFTVLAGVWLDGGNDSRTRFKDFTLVVEPQDIVAPKITTDEFLGTFMVGDEVSIQLEATGTQPITWTVDNIPAGLSMNSSGSISGVATLNNATVGVFAFNVTATNAAGSDSRRFSLKIDTPIVDAPKITTSSDLGTYVVGNIPIQLNATGTEPLTWTAEGLPDGFTIAKNGYIFGKIDIADEYSFTATVSNSAGSDSRKFKFVVIPFVPPVQAPVIKTSSDLGEYNANEELSFPIKATGSAPLTWTADDLPAGMNMSDTGVVYGTITDTITEVTTYEFTVTVSNTAGEDSRTFKFTIKPVTIAPKITTLQDLGTYEHDVDVEKQFEATGTEPITWSVTWSAGGKPDWLEFDAGTATLTGKTPSKNTSVKFKVTARNTAGKDTRDFKIIVSEDHVIIPPTISTDTLPNGQEKQHYNMTLEAAGTAPITWTITGLPSGLTPSSSGKIYGVPTVNGTFTVNVKAENSAGSDTREYQLFIEPDNVPLPPKILTQELPNAMKDKAYNFLIEAEGKDITWSATFKSLQDFGITQDGLIFGTPKAAGTYNITIKAKNTAGTDFVNLTLYVDDPDDKDKPVILSSKLPDAFNGEEYSYFLEAEGTVKTWKLPDGPDSLPTGLELLPSGEITGTPNSSKVKTFKFKVVATNEAGDSDPRTISLKVVAKTPEFKESELKAATWNKKYSYTVKVLNMKPTVWSIDGDLPEGLKFDKGKFSGKPTEVGEFEFTITASNGATELTDYFTLNVKGVDPKIKGSFKKGNEGEEYSATLKATGVTPMTWDIEDLPDGLDYTPSATGEECTISGVPQTTFNGKVTVKVSNGSGDEETSVSKGLKMNIKAVKPKFATKAIDVENGYVDTRYSFQLVLSTKSTEVVWSYTGDMPDGLTLDEDSGLLYGMPIKEEVCRFIVFAANANKPSYKAKLQIAMEILPKSEAPKSDTDPEPEPEPEQPEFVNGIAYHERGELTNETLATIARNDEVIAAVLPALEVEEAGMYDFTVSLDVNAPEGGLLVWHSFPDGEDDDGDDENAVFLDENGEVFERVPETYSVTVSAWLEPGVIYEPIIAVKIRN